MFTNFSRMFVFSAFKLNQKYIASTLCENRDKPEMHCNGKCYLTKKIKQAEEREKKEEQDGQKKNFQENYILRQCSVEFPFSFELKMEHIIEDDSFLPKQTSEVLHPPPTPHHFLS
ncbi:hypothetical protein [Pedobacter antarcticus]|nr:hypothetical protein [Pedobacter antarcticus]